MRIYKRFVTVEKQKSPLILRLKGFSEFVNVLGGEGGFCNTSKYCWYPMVYEWHKF